MSPDKKLTIDLTGRDLINVGIFSGIYFALMFAPGFMGMINPALSLVGYVVGILGNGVVAMLYLSRVPKLGALTLLMALLSIFMVLTGIPWYALLIVPALGFCADLIARSGKFRSPLRNTIAYALLVLWYLVPILPVVLDEVGYREYVSSTMGETYATIYLAIFTPSNLIFIGIGFFIVGLAGGALGQRLLGKHFRRAGVAR